MKVINKTRGTILAEDMEAAKSYSSRVRGLIAAPKPRPIFFETRWGIHTFGVRFPIDVVIFDEKGIIKNTKENMLPAKIFLWSPKYKNVLELPAGKVKESKTSIGDRIEVIKSI